MTRNRRIAALVACVGVAAGLGLAQSGGHGSGHDGVSPSGNVSARVSVRGNASGPVRRTLPLHYAGTGAKFEPADGSVYLGVSTDIDRIDEFDSLAGITAHPAIYDQYTWPDGPVSPTLSNAASMPGTTPMVSWNLPLADGTVASGQRDGYLRAQADAVRQFGGPVFLRVDWEMNGTWYADWNVPAVPPSAYIDAWRHVYEVFQAEGATNAAFVWCVNTWPGPGGTDVTAWYPGDAYVDWVGVDGYPQSSAADYLMRGPDGLDALASFAAAHRKPLMLAEWAPQLPQPDAAAAVDLVLDWAAAHPATVKALVYFDFSVEAKDFRLIDHPIGAAELRRRTRSDPKYLETVVGAD